MHCGIPNAYKYRVNKKVCMCLWYTTMDRVVKDRNMPVVPYCMWILYWIGGENGGKVDVNPRGTVDTIVSSILLVLSSPGTGRKWYRRAVRGITHVSRWCWEATAPYMVDVGWRRCCRWRWGEIEAACSYDVICNMSWGCTTKSVCWR
jgi:hypothetical protein